MHNIPAKIFHFSGVFTLQSKHCNVDFSNYVRTVIKICNHSISIIFVQDDGSHSCFLIKHIILDLEIPLICHDPVDWSGSNDRSPKNTTSISSLRILSFFRFKIYPVSRNLLTIWKNIITPFDRCDVINVK